jgi:hypothetical protein
MPLSCGGCRQAPRFALARSRAISGIRVTCIVVQPFAIGEISPAHERGEDLQIQRLAEGPEIALFGDHATRFREEVMSTHVTISPAEAADRLAIRELVEAYAHCADRRDAKGQMSLFTTDTHFVVYMNAKEPTPSQELKSREALTPVFADLGGISRLTFQMNAASLPHAKLMRAIEALGTRVAPALKGELAGAS